MVSYTTASIVNMACSFEEGSIVTLIIISGALLSIIIAISCVLTNRSIERSLRGILVSYLIANVIGSSFFTYDVLTHPCKEDDLYVNFMYQMTMLMSLAHLLLLILHYHTILTSSRKKKGRDFIGLILTAWIAAATSGCVNASLDENIRGIAVLFVFVVILAIATRAYYVVLRQHKKKEAIHLTYIKTFLYIEEEEDGAQPAQGQWNLRFLAAILVSFVSCSIPWLVINVSGFHEDRKLFEHSISLSIYMLSYYVPSFICIYMKCKNFKTKEETTGNSSLEEAYRLRHYSRQHSPSVIVLESDGASATIAKAAKSNGKVNEAYVVEHHLHV